MNQKRSSLITKLITAEQLAQEWNIPVGTIRNKTSNGSLPHFKIGGLVRYSLEDLQSYLLENKRGSNGN